jgi:membrane-associated protease RseP (regulator of RpoE activity)
MHTSVWRSPGPRPILALASLLLLAWTGAGVPLAAQDAARDCRCVDRDGTAIERCVCVRSFDPSEVFGIRSFAVPRARIGVTLEDHPEGARINEILEDSPAEAAGLAAGDVIVRVSGHRLLDPLPDAARERTIAAGSSAAVERLMALARDWEPGERVDLEVLRGGERRTVSVETEDAPQAFALRAFGGSAPEVRAFGPGGRFEVRADSLLRRFDFDSLGIRAPAVFRADSLGRAMAFSLTRGCGGARGRLSVFDVDCVDGVHLIELNPDLGDYFGASEGVLVSSVEEGSALGLRAGDVILSVGGRAVETPEQALRVLSSYGAGEAVPMRVLRRGDALEIEGRRR